MSMQGRIRELSSKHRELDERIQSVQKRPIIDTVELSDLKRRKLRLKEQLSNLER